MTTNRATYSRGYCRAYATPGLVVVDHHMTDTKRDIARAARECNYAAGNWNRSRLVRLGGGRKAGARSVTFYAIVRG